MEMITDYLNEVLLFFREGFAHVNAVLGIIIAGYSAWKMGDWKALWASALGAVLIHLIAAILVPVVDHDAPFRLPPLLDYGFWRDTVALYLGYVVAIAALFFVKTRVLSGGGGGGHH